MKLNFRKIHPEAQIPEYATKGAAGMDLHARISQDIYLQPGVRWTCPTGIAMDIPAGFTGLICPRSGLAKKHGVTVLNAPGVIDSDYRGEIGVILINHGDEAIKISPGDRIAQMLIVPIGTVELEQVGALSETDRGEGGFGSTGV